MNTSIPFFIILVCVGVFTFLSAVYNWTWFWQISSIGNWVYKRYGHEATRFLYGFTGMLLVAAVIKDMLFTIAIGKIIFVGVLLTAISFASYRKQKPSEESN